LKEGRRQKVEGRIKRGTPSATVLESSTWPCLCCSFHCSTLSAQPSV
jgi:hypothetical protein